MIQTVLNGMITVLMAKFMLNDVPHTLGFKPSSIGNPGGPEASKIIARTGMKEYEYHWFPEPEEPSKPRGYVYRKVVHVINYEVAMTRTNSTCTIKLYEFTEGWKKKLRATWTGFQKPECDNKFRQVVGTIRQVKLEEVTALRR